MRIGEMFNIPIRVHWSWLIGFFIITWLVASGGLPFIRITLSTTQEWAIAVLVTVCLFLSVLLHELAHSLTAKRLGYKVYSITLMIFGGVSLISDTRMRSSHDFLIAAAGPAMSLLLGVVAAALYLIYRDPGASGASAMLQGMLFYIGFQNIALAIFNMLPGLPLDGGRVLQAVIWGLTGNRNFAARFAGRAGQVLAVGMMLLAAYMVFFQQNLTSGLWLFLIASFILPASTVERQRASGDNRSERASALPVRSVMSPVPAALNADTPLDAAVRKVISFYPSADIPVIDGGRVTATVSMSDITSLGLNQNQGAELRVSDVARPVSTFSIEPDTDLSHALALLTKRGVDLLLVFENGALIGTVSQTDLRTTRPPA